MTTLPSFVELMASLGLENRDSSSDSQSLNRHSRSSSYSSSSSIISQTSSDSSPSLVNRVPLHSPSIVVSGSPGKDVEMDRRRHHIRYSPYSPAISHIRRGSLPTNVKEEELEDQLRAGSSSPRRLSPPRSVGRRSSAVGLTNGTKRPQKLTLDADLIANMPISTFLRRKTPQSSPISPTFPCRSKRSSSPSLPVSIPTLPTFFFPQQQAQPFATGNMSSDTDDDMMSDSSASLGPTRRQRKPAGRQRSTSRLSEPALSTRRNRHRRRISPLA
ncbi:hypothetical protein NM688_g7148 [Phlebia brevispora]|uniref:Uncharacterized protein n=1 Tax=Phlebia brevispora TaxID=194682 RepID=A0ACC1S8W2_9APHY|nr:hypothetical protein NM688_g7148 [Phlebia brevispora]